MEVAAGGPSALGEDLVHRLHVRSAEVLLHARVLLIRPDDSSARVTSLSDDGASGPLENLQQVLPYNNKLNDRILLRSNRRFRRFRRFRRCFGGRHGDDRACCHDSGSEARGRQSRCCRQKRSSNDEEEARPHARGTATRPAGAKGGKEITGTSNSVTSENFLIALAKDP